MYASENTSHSFLICISIYRQYNSNLEVISKVTCLDTSVESGLIETTSTAALVAAVSALEI